MLLLTVGRVDLHFPRGGRRGAFRTSIGFLNSNITIYERRKFMLKSMAPRIICLLILLVTITGAVHADRNIVYAARYYLSPGKKGHSHFHLYRINPDGSGRIQITHGNYDDTVPRWSPDGKSVLFNRDIKGRDSICMVSSAGGAVKICASASYIFDARWDPTGRRVSFFQSVEGSQDYWLSLIDISNMKVRRYLPADSCAWSPDGRKLYVSSEEHGGGILDLRTGKYANIGADLREAVWLDSNIILVYHGLKPGISPTLRVLSIKGQVQKELPISIKEPDITGDGAFPDALYRIPGQPDEVIYAAHAGDSTSGSWGLFYLVNLKTGAFHRVSDGDGISWEAGGNRFATGYPRELTERKPDEYLWTSPLTIISTNGYTKKNIVSGMVWVDGIDWRRKP